MYIFICDCILETKPSTHTRSEILLLPDTLMHNPETPSNIARSAFTDGFLPMLLNHEGAFHGPGAH